MAVHLFLREHPEVALRMWHREDDRQQSEGRVYAGEREPEPRDGAGDEDVPPEAVEPEHLPEGERQPHGDDRQEHPERLDFLGREADREDRHDEAVVDHTDEQHDRDGGVLRSEDDPGHHQREGDIRGTRNRPPIGDHLPLRDEDGPAHVDQSGTDGPTDRGEEKGASLPDVLECAAFQERLSDLFRCDSEEESHEDVVEEVVGRDDAVVTVNLAHEMVVQDWEVEHVLVRLIVQVGPDQCTHCSHEEKYGVGQHELVQLPQFLYHGVSRFQGSSFSVDCTTAIPVGACRLGQWLCA